MCVDICVCVLLYDDECRLNITILLVFIIHV